jgi:hypothetical protein
MSEPKRPEPPVDEQPQAEWFWEQVDRTSTPDWCWEWTGPRNRAGYGTIWVNGHKVGAHRIALELAGWIIPCEWLRVRHCVCNNPPCCRPSHLRIGTPQDDRDDVTKSGRQARGERIAQAVLDPAKVQEILALYQRGVRGRGKIALAKQFGVGPTAIFKIIRGESWKHVARREAAR